MATVRVEQRTFSVAGVGPESPLPQLRPPPQEPYTLGAGVPEDIAQGAAYGQVSSLYPYRQQDDYNRVRGPRRLTTVVLENNRLRAVFLPELGGRLWELFDKGAGKQLLHSPAGIQFANLALRNAWFAGGIEWNIGTRGHSPFTASPLHAALVATPDCGTVLRMWEFERLRSLVFQIDAWLPEDSPVLLISIRVLNPQATAAPLYWWSNAAVPQTSGTRVLVPAEYAYGTDYAGCVNRVVPHDLAGVDATWPMRNTSAADYFFELPEGQRRWQAAVDDDGDGLALLSTPPLRGRKLFVWGTGAGGRRWQRWLSPSGGEYAEIQAGLARTQFEHLRMPPGASWHWVEAYGNAAVEPGRAHSEDWRQAVAAGAAGVEALAPAAVLEAALAKSARWLDLPPTQPVLWGSGWGYLESQRRQASAEPWLRADFGGGMPFPAESVGPEQAPWLDLLSGRSFAGAPSDVAGADWAARLAGAPNSAAALYHLAVLHHAEGALEQAVGEYEQSLALAESALARRGLGLALLAEAEADHSGSAARHAGAERGLAQLRAACVLEPRSVPLLREAMDLHLAHSAAPAAVELVRRAPDALAASGRVQFLTAVALARSGNQTEAAALLRAGIEVADLREGEDSLAGLWAEVCPGEPVPGDYQFSMKSPPGVQGSPVHG